MMSDWALEEALYVHCVICKKGANATLFLANGLQEIVVKC